METPNPRQIVAHARMIQTDLVGVSRDLAAFKSTGASRAPEAGRGLGPNAKQVIATIALEMSPLRQAPPLTR